MTHRLKHARLPVQLLLAAFAGTEFVPSLDPCPMQPRAAAVRPNVDPIPQPLRFVELRMRGGPPSETGYDCPLYEAPNRDPPLF